MNSKFAKKICVKNKKLQHFTEWPSKRVSSPCLEQMRQIENLKERYLNNGHKMFGKVILLICQKQFD